MTDLARGRTSTSDAAPVPHSYATPPAPTPTGNGDPGQWALEDDLAAAEAAQAAAARKVRIAELSRDELGDDAKPSARAIADDRLDTAAAAYTAAETRTYRARAGLDAADGRDEAPDGQADELAYPSADAWLRGWLLPNWRRPIEARWCPKWWLHAEAVSRLEAIWRAWEYLRSDGALGPSVWWRDHADYHLAVLTTEYGTFARCNYRREHHQQVDTLPAVPNPLNLDDFIP